MSGDIHTFLSRVIPWPSDEGQGYVNVHWHAGSGSPWYGRCVSSVDEMTEVAQRWSDEKHNVYFCLSRQRLNGGTRNIENATHIKAIWLDIDCEYGNPKKYATLTEATEALRDFLDRAGLPGPSALVRSGGGLHVYYISDRPLSVEEWYRYAGGLRYLALEYGLRCDAGITTDPARVLRVPGTRNFKKATPRAVSVVGLKETDYDFATDLAMLPPHASEPTAKSGSLGVTGRVAEAFRHIPLEDWGVFTPVGVDTVAKACPWIKAALETGGKDYDNNQWYLSTLCATFMEDGHAVAHRLGNQHPTYKPDDTDQLWNRVQSKGAGPPRCETIRAAGSTVCASCVQLGRKLSPIILAREAQEQVAAPAAETLADELIPQELPRGYVYNKEDGIDVQITKTKKGEEFTERMEIIKSKLWDWSNTTEALQFRVQLYKGRNEVKTLYRKDMTPNRINTALAEIGVFCNALVPNKYIVEFFVAFLNKLNRAIAAQDPPVFGWEHRGPHAASFIYGGKRYDMDGTIKELSIDRGHQADYVPVGEIEPWYEAAKTVTDQKRPELDLILAIPFASPVMEFSGENGGLISAWGPPGTTKSTASKVAAAVWGHPILTRESLNSTYNSVIHRLGKIKNLPAYWDDIQRVEGQKHLWQTGFTVTQGVEKGRLTTDIKQQERGSWRTLLLACSNISFVDYVIKMSPDTSASLLRVLEYKIEAKNSGRANNIKVGQIVSKLDRNYGRVGEKYAALIATRGNEITERFNATTDRFTERVRARQDERLWTVMCAALLTGAYYACQLDVEINLAALENFLAQTFLDNRIRRNLEGVDGGTERNTTAMLNAFLNEYIGKGHALYTDTAPLMRGGPHTEAANVQRAPLAGRPLYVHFIIEQRLLRISQREFRKFVGEQDAGVSAVVSGLKQFYLMEQTSKRLGGGTEYSSAPERVFEFKIPADSPLSEMLFRHSVNHENQE